MALARRATVVPAPINVLPAQSFMGDDGKWSTFTVAVGTPPQNFRILPSTQVSETWVILPDGCISSDPADCQTQRGGQPFNGQAPVGFLTNQSSTWEEIGLYSIQTEAALNGSINGVFGSDTVGLNGGNSSSASGGVSLAKQTVGGIAAKDVFLGVLGLSIAPSSFSSAANPIQTFLYNLYHDNLIPSLSFGYTAGASYGDSKLSLASKQIETNRNILGGKYNWGSLVLGGFDSTKIKNATGISIPFSAQDNQALTVGVQSIVATNVKNGTASMTTNGGHLSLIDSTVTQLWLPGDVCDQFAGNLNLTYDANTDLYVLPPDVHSSLQSANPSFTFKIGPTAYDNGGGVSIVFPYSAFDYSVGWPFYNETVYYFPIRRAANSTQYVLGRTFLQQAHIVVDYGRRNFTIAPADFPDTTVDPLLVGISNGSPSHKNALGTGAIVGIAIGGVALAVLAVLAFFWFRRRRGGRSRKAKVSELEGNDSTMDAQYSKVPGIHEADGEQVVELPDPYNGSYQKPTKTAELDVSAPIYEMEGDYENPGHGQSPDASGRTLTPHTNTSGRGSTPFSPVSDLYSPAQPSPMSHGDNSRHPSPRRPSPAVPSPQEIPPR
jgi:aspartyl protease